MSVLVVLEQSGGKWNRMSWETLVAGQQLAAEMSTELHAAIPGSGIGALAAEAAYARSARKSTRSSTICSKTTRPMRIRRRSKALIRATNPTLVLFPHTYQVRDFAPKLATRFSQVLISDVIAVRIESGSPVFVRLLFQGKLNGDVRVSGGGPYFASLQAGSFRAEALEAGSAPVETFRSFARRRGDPPEARSSVPRVGTRSGFDDCRDHRLGGARDQGEGKYSHRRGTGQGSRRGARGIASDLRRGLAAHGAPGRAVRGRRWRRRCTWPSESPARSSISSG